MLDETAAMDTEASRLANDVKLTNPDESGYRTNRIDIVKSRTFMAFLGFDP